MAHPKWNPMRKLRLARMMKPAMAITVAERVRKNWVSFIHVKGFSDMKAMPS